MTPGRSGGDSRDMSAPGTLGPWTWIVTWGVMLRPGWHALRVVAFDAEEALAVARALRPDLPNPRTAYLAAVRDDEAFGGSGSS